MPLVQRKVSISSRGKRSDSRPCNYPSVLGAGGHSACSFTWEGMALPIPQ